MKKILFRLTTVGEDLYISFYNTSTTGHKRNFEIDIPERIGFHIFTDEEYKLFSEFDLIPDVIDTVLAVGEFDNPVLAVGCDNQWTTSYIKEENGKWIGHQPLKLLALYRNMIHFMMGFVSVFLSFWILQRFNLL